MEFVKECFVLLFKKLVEYKTNFLMVFFVQIIHMIVYWLMMIFLFDNFSDLGNWAFEEFVLFFILNDFLIVFSGIFIWKSWIANSIIKGDFNNYLNKPINPYLFFFFLNMNFDSIVYGIVASFLYFGVLVFYGVSLVNVFLGSGLLFLVFIFFVVIYEFFYSLDWILLGLTNKVWKPYSSFNEIFRMYPGKFFENFKFRIFLFMSPLFFVATLVVPIFRGIEVVYFFEQVCFLVTFSLFLVGLTFFVWKYGLKRYEAFG